MISPAASASHLWPCCSSCSPAWLPALPKTCSFPLWCLELLRAGAQHLLQRLFDLLRSRKSHQEKGIRVREFKTTPELRLGLEGFAAKIPQQSQLQGKAGLEQGPARSWVLGGRGSCLGLFLESPGLDGNRDGCLHRPRAAKPGLAELGFAKPGQTWGGGQAGGTAGMGAPQGFVG